MLPDFDPPPPAHIEKIKGLFAGFRGYAKENGLHLGVGDPAECPTCETPWPCPVEVKRRRPVVDSPPL